MRFIPAPAGNTGTEYNGIGRVAVHPRSRGEHRFRFTSRNSFCGSSPLPRGTRQPGPPQGGFGRFIPAPAGNTLRQRSDLRPWSVHPRSRGEHRAVLRGRAMMAGSSPLPRGTRAGTTARGCQARFIPAPAGNTSRTPKQARSNTVHPRSRGEHRRRWRCFLEATGSSPLPRGTLADIAAANVFLRFIPAPAGNTVHPAVTSWPPAVHPRSRGEHRPPDKAKDRDDGSSPLPRGTRLRPLLGCRCARFIPAPAGNTVLNRRNPGFWRGSSPLPRGTHNLGCRRHVCVRFIPAPAGNTQERGARCSQRTVHPRSRGEHANTRSVCASPIGSSPLPRGTHQTQPTVFKRKNRMPKTHQLSC